MLFNEEPTTTNTPSPPLSLPMVWTLCVDSC